MSEYESINNIDAAFVIYHKGKALKLKWQPTAPPNLFTVPVVRLCALCDKSPQLLLLNANNCLYAATLSDDQCTLQLNLERRDVLDVGYCHRTQELFIVTDNGHVLKQQFNTNSCYQAEDWQSLSFDPVGISEEDICVTRVCCSAEGALFLTQHNDIYVLGTCGDIFTAPVNPIQKKLFENGKQMLDIAAGDEFFVMLVRTANPEKAHMLQISKKEYQDAACHVPSHIRSISRQNTLEIEFDLDMKNVNKSDLQLNASTQSLSSQSEQNQSNSLGVIMRHILNQGLDLLNTQVYSFGAINNGLLGTGDHIKRASLSNIQKLDCIGVTSIAAGREHSVVRTLDGRLYHWGLNSQQQLNSKVTITDISAPKEIKMDSITLTEKERNILESCCGAYETVLLNSLGALSDINSKQKSNYDKTFLSMQMGTPTHKHENIKLLHVAGDFTLHNLRALRTEYNSCLINLQTQLQLHLKYAHAVEMLRVWQKKFICTALKQLQHICTNFERVTYVLAATVYSLESYYRGDISNPADLLFIRYYQAYIEIFEYYSKSYCDIYSINGFREAASAFAQNSSVPIMPNNHDETDLARIFKQPFQIFPIFIQFLRQLLKTRSEFKEQLTAWVAYERQSCINQELAESTQEFWSKNIRNMRISHFRRKHRRVILTSHAVPLKLTNNPLSISSTSFILFSDYFCQVGGSTIYTYPLCTIWLKSENDVTIKVITPEKHLTLTTPTAQDKKLWQEQLETSIAMALKRPVGSKAPNIRTTAHIFSKNHPKYANVQAYGVWKNGLLHGMCSLKWANDCKCYYGEMAHGEIEGYGKMIIPQYGVYEGYFKAGKFHGQGVYEMADNEIYEGNFRDGLFHGHGLLRSNRYTYIGEFQGNSKNGYGVYDDLITGDKYMGMFAANKRTGAGICITMCGNYFEGLFANDELVGNGTAVFNNDYYYEGELNMLGPMGKGTYYMPSGTIKLDEPLANVDDEYCNYELTGIILSGQLSGSWEDVNMQQGRIKTNQRFSKYPNSIGELVVDNYRKWRSLFENFETQVLGVSIKKPIKSKNCTSEQLWCRIAIYMNRQRLRERATAQQDHLQSTTRSFFAKNIIMGLSNNFDALNAKVSHKINNLLDLTGSSILTPRRIHSQEALCSTELHKSDSLQSINSIVTTNGCDDDLSFASLQLDNNMLDCTVHSMYSSIESALNLSCSSSNNNNSISSQSTLDFVPNFGINTLTEQDVNNIKEYLTEAFKNPHHPLHLLNARIENCFYYSYGCWKVKPTPILAKQAMHEWESISKRIYKFVRKMFPALPEDYCIIESTREAISHITLLYPIVLSEGIYSTLFVLYANKYKLKDEIYRQNFTYAEKLSNTQLIEMLGLDSSYINVANHACFKDAIQTLKELQKKFCPKAMLTVIENCMQLVTDAYKEAENQTAALLTADNMMPLTLLLVLRAAVPLLGAELALLDDLTGGANFQLEMSGLAGYCYTTLKASYEHVAAEPWQKT